LELSRNPDYEEANSIYVSFENKEIFENAIKLSKIEAEGQDLSHCNFKKLPDQQNPLLESQDYEHPMINSRKVLGEVSLNTKSKTTTKDNRLEGTLKKFQGQQANI